jgi:ERCC4-type nuclease
MNDLAASIRDSRYKEQSYRLHQCSLHNHNIFYLLEGQFSCLEPRYNKNTLLSAMVSISYTKGFSIYRTVNIVESAEWIVRFAEKLNRIKKPPFYYCKQILNLENKSDDIECNKRKLANIDNYSSVVKRVKKNNVTHDNIGEIMLMQIPGVSHISAKVIMNKYKTIHIIFEI